MSWIGVNFKLSKIYAEYVLYTFSVNNIRYVLYNANIEECVVENK